jgi:hypothetical protein
MRKEVKLSKSQLMGLNPYMQQLQAATGQVNEYFFSILQERGENPNLAWRFTEEGSLITEVPDADS